MKDVSKQAPLERREDTRYRRLWSGAIVLVIALGLAFPAGNAFAQADATTVLNYFLLAIANLLNWIINALGSLLIMIVDLIIQVAQFNTFTKAAPVQAGWPLVRDVTNMFFIVILLVTAFSTIVRWSKFQYKQILPKMLLMAVLINFSLPILGLAIDFSQVLMLTFVNAFKAAAGGNFVAALKLDKIMQLRTDQSYLQQLQSNTNTQLHDLLGAEILAIIIMGMSTTLVAIMLVYLIARIVGLWLSLIMSPAAFLMTAMPSTIASKMSGVADEFWGKFGALCSGGPIMAFYLWLTLATVQNGGFNALTVQNYAGSGEVSQVQAYFATAIGDVTQFGTYIVAMVMMFMGVSSAVSWSKQVAPVVGSVSEKVRRYGTNATKFLAYGGLAAGGAIGVRGVGAGAVGVGNFVDRRTNVTGRVGGRLQRFGAATGITPLATAGAYVAGTRRRAVERHAERLEKTTDKLSPAEKLAIFEKRARRGNADEKKAAEHKIIKSAFTKGGMDYFEGKYANDATAKTLKQRAAGRGPEAEDAKVALKAYTKKKRDDELRSKLSEYEKSVKGNSEEEEWVREKVREKMPVYAEKVAEHATAEMGKDQMYFKKIRQDQFEDGAAVTGLMAGADRFLNGNAIDMDSVLGKATTGNSVRAKIMREHVSRLVAAAQATGDPTITAETLLKNPEKLKELGFMGGRYEEDKRKPNGFAFVNVSEFENAHPAPAAEAEPEAQGAPGRRRARVLRDEGEIRAGRQMIEEQERIINDAQYPDPDNLRARNARLQPGWRPGNEQAPVADTLEIARARERINNIRQDMVNAGAGFDEAYSLEHEAFRTAEDREAFGNHVEHIHEQGRGNEIVYQNIDLDVLDRNPDGPNAAREAFVDHTNVADLHGAFERAEGSKNKAVLDNIAHMVRAVVSQGAHIESMIDQHNQRVNEANSKYIKQVGPSNVDQNRLQKTVDKQQISQIAMTPPDQNRGQNIETALRQALQGTNFEMNRNDLNAIRKREEVRQDRFLSALERVASPRAARAVRGSGATAAPTNPQAQPPPNRRGGNT
ncbi:MAG: hypothetical protein WC477_04520 [Patescibacteria group bacterium]